MPWPKDEAEADELWRGRIASELLQEKLSEHPIEPGPQLVGRRYDRIARNVHEEDRDEQVKLYLDALAQTYDPHSEYLSKADFKNFNIQMGLSLVGIGAMLRTEDGYAKIESLVTGGPAQVDGRLKVGDRITAAGEVIVGDYLHLWPVVEVRQKCKANVFVRIRDDTNNSLHTFFIAKVHHLSQIGQTISVH